MSSLYPRFLFLPLFLLGLVGWSFEARSESIFSRMWQQEFKDSPPISFQDLKTRLALYPSANPGTTLDRKKINELAPIVNERLRKVVVGASRSPQRDLVTLEYPRQLVSENEDLNSFPKYFMAYTPLNEEVESISWDEDLKRFEFEVLKDFAPGKTPRLEKANREFCMTCHQGGAGIFTRGPWLETQNNVTIRAHIEHRALNAMAVEKRLLDNPTLELTKKQELDVFASIGHLATGLGDVVSFDGAVRESSDAAQVQRMCLELCQNSKCRRDLIKLSFTSFLAMHSEIEIGFLGSHVDKDPTLLLAHPSSVLPDRDPFSFSEEGGLVRLFKKTEPQRSSSQRNSWRQEYQSKGFNVTFDPNSTTSSLSGSRNTDVFVITGIDGNHPGNPAHPRPLTQGAFEMSMKHKKLMRLICLGISSEDEAVLEQLSIVDFETILAAAENDFKALVEDHWPPREGEIMAIFEKAMKSEVATVRFISEGECREISAEAMAVPQSTQMEMIEMEEVADKKLQDHQKRIRQGQKNIQTYCSSCHTDQVPYTTDPVGFAAYKSPEGLTAIDRLLGNHGSSRMPPSNAPNQPSPDEIKDMIYFLKWAVE